MNAPLSTAVLDTLDVLAALNAEAVRPPEARQRLRPIQARHPAARIDLLWQEEAYDGSVQYDALLRLDGGGTVSVSVCPDRALPWPLRGIHRWKEHDLLRVNDRVLEVGEAIQLLDVAGSEARLADRLVDACVLRDELDERPVTVSDDDLQRALDGFRRARGLATAEATRRFMAERGLTHEALEALVEERATIAALRERLTAAHVDGYFEAHRADFDRARIAVLEVPDEATADRLAAEIGSGATSFLEAAERAFLAAPAGGPPRELFRTVSTGAAGDALGRAVAAARPGEVVGPVRIATGFALARVLAREPARLDGPTREAIQRILFDRWLAQRRRAARIEWYWGTAATTGAAGN